MVCDGKEGCILVNTRTDWEMSEPCEKNTCPRCSWSTSKSIELLLQELPLTAFVTFTGLPEVWTDARYRLQVLQKRLRRRHVFKWVYTLERNRRGGTHAHALLIGSVPSITELRDGSMNVFSSFEVDSRPVELEHMSYMTKGSRPSHKLGWPEAKAKLADHLDLNGGQHLHTSRQFWQGPLRSESPSSPKDQR